MSRDTRIILAALKVAFYHVTMMLLDGRGGAKRPVWESFEADWDDAVREAEAQP